MCTFVSAFINFCLSTDTSVEELRETTEALQKAAVIHGSLTFPKNQHFSAACTIALLILIISVQPDARMMFQMTPLAYLSNRY